VRLVEQSWFLEWHLERLEPELEYNPKMPAPVTVYVVDDEPIIASTLVAILNLSGFQATAFTNTEAALEASKSGCPSLLITDVVMPGMDGIELAIQLKLECPDCKVLLLSGQPATGNLLSAARDAGHDFKVLAKPVPPEELLAAIKSLDLLAPSL
jgi:CheY-like chemotaxis protein